ncbi:protein Pxr1, partial [Trichinella spiralis]|uniref:protein Pxr1 n=1 Tax=Trichinella spiralis TaxID=6334 RepID=UPI0001EFD806
AFARQSNGKAENNSSERSSLSRKGKRSRKQATATASKSSGPVVKYNEKVDEPKNDSSRSSEMGQATRRLEKKSKARRKQYRRTLDNSEVSSSVFEIARRLRKQAIKSVSPETISSKGLPNKM